MTGPTQHEPTTALGGLRDASPGHYPPDEAMRARMLVEGLIALDTNVLLNLYRYTPEARDEFVSLLRRLGDRLFVAHQVAVEYEHNRIDVIAEQGRIFTAFVENLDGAQQTAEQQVAAVLKQCGRAQAVEVRAAESAMQQAMQALRETIRAVRSSHDAMLPQAVHDDPVRAQLENLLSGRVGRPPTREELAALRAEAKIRYDMQIPPGFSDVKRKTSNTEGDYIVWSQIMDEAARRSLPVVLVTDDGKPDWVRREANIPVGPHPALIAEMRERAGVDFALVNSEAFLIEAGKALVAAVSDDTVAEARASREAEAVRDTDFYLALLRNPEVLGVKPGRGGTFSRLALQQMLGDDADWLDPYRGPGGVVPRSVLAEFLRRRDLTANLARLREEVEDLESLGDDEVYAPHDRRQRVQDLAGEIEETKFNIALIEQRLRHLRHVAERRRNQDQPPMDEGEGGQRMEEGGDR